MPVNCNSFSGDNSGFRHFPPLSQGTDLLCGLKLVNNGVLTVSGVMTSEKINLDVDGGFVAKFRGIAMAGSAWMVGAKPWHRSPCLFYNCCWDGDHLVVVIGSLSRMRVTALCGGCCSLTTTTK